MLDVMHCRSDRHQPAVPDGRPERTEAHEHETNPGSLREACRWPDEANDRAVSESAPGLGGQQERYRGGHPGRRNDENAEGQ